MSSAEVTAGDITGLVSKAGLKLEDGHDQDYSVLMSALEDSIAQLGDDQALMPRPDLSKYPRTHVHVPQDSEGGGWATKARKILTKDGSVTIGETDSGPRQPSWQPRRLDISSKARHLP